MDSPDSIKVAVDLSKGIFVQAKGHPAKVVAYGASAAVVFAAVALGYGGYQGGKALYGGVRALLAKKKRQASDAADE
jgi:hypothetical protein